MSSESLHEPRENLPDEVIDLHRAIVSLMEELEAVDWYNQRAAVCTDPELKGILEHNRDEEIEHAAMVLEWIRRSTPRFDEELRTYLFADGSILDAETEATSGEGESGSSPGGSSETGGIHLGDLRGQGNT